MLGRVKSYSIATRFAPGIIRFRLSKTSALVFKLTVVYFRKSMQLKENTFVLFVRKPTKQERVWNSTKRYTAKNRLHANFVTKNLQNEYIWSNIREGIREKDHSHVINANMLLLQPPSYGFIKRLNTRKLVHKTDLNKPKSWIQWVNFCWTAFSMASLFLKSWAHLLSSNSCARICYACDKALESAP